MPETHAILFKAGEASALSILLMLHHVREPVQPALEPVLYLNGDGVGIVNNCCFPSAVAPSYAPPEAVRQSCDAGGLKLEIRLLGSSDDWASAKCCPCGFH